MAGTGPAPAKIRRRRNAPARGDWQAAPALAWKHGPIPDAPGGLMPATVLVWRGWFESWWAANWTPEYIPQIAVAIRLYDSVERGNLKDATELRQAMDGIGATFKGQQDRRWQPPKSEDKPVGDQHPDTPDEADPYKRLRVVS